MKVGDKLLCKKKYHPAEYSYYYNNNLEWFTIGKYYIIVTVTSTYIFIKNNDDDDDVHFDIFNDIRLGAKSHGLLNEYFYTDQEIRKMKLNKIVDTK